MEEGGNAVHGGGGYAGGKGRKKGEVSAGALTTHCYVGWLLYACTRFLKQNKLGRNWGGSEAGFEPIYRNISPARLEGVGVGRGMRICNDIRES